MIKKRVKGAEIILALGTEKVRAGPVYTYLKLIKLMLYNIILY
jgi:hypothetical protein